MARVTHYRMPTAGEMTRCGYVIGDEVKWTDYAKAVTCKDCLRLKRWKIPTDGGTRGGGDDVPR
jgi:hypothetical protein